MLDEMLAAVARRYRLLESSDGRRSLSEEVRSRCSTLGRDVRVMLESDTVEGRAVDIGDDGRLVIELADGELRRFDAGDVVHLR